MLRKIQTSQGRRKFYHEQNRELEPKVHAVTRPPTSHPYSSLRHIRSYETVQNYNYFAASEYDR